MPLADIKEGLRDAKAVDTVVEMLGQRFGSRCQTGRALREQHAHTTSYIPPQPPDAVVYPETAEEVQAIVRLCNEHRVAIVPFGVGTSLEGHVNAPSGGICLDMGRMNRVIEVNQADLDCTVEPGITRTQLNSYLRDTGLFFPLDPGADATIGGMAATRASGTNAVRYGTMRENVIALEAVMADGTLIRTAHRARKTSAGYDLTRLLVGSEGTLGIITSVTLRLQGIPETIAGGLCAFPTLEAACNAVVMTIQMGVPVARIEILDAMQMKACNAYSGLNYAQVPTLFVEFHGNDETVAIHSRTFGDIAAEFGGSDFQWTRDPEERARLWDARHNAYFASLQLRPGANGLSTDVCVPISRLAECIAGTQADIAELGLLAPIVGHAGDGNFHVLALMDMQDRAEIDRVEEFVRRLNSRALSMDGTCTGEHGIGQGKQRFLVEELGDALQPMRQIKRALDPNGILNPGKIFALET
ncbi:FAD-binding oxidoreductase [Pararhizobium mangrovi]|uniref:D-lactate dehydrogenase (cytochrome) n=1 Tax=Pararhizobium mangrovi TaxID=2590452 RepID=A0A506U8X9_9HYPH|nr:FAD-linked oxidase C-terminal domain-containing protein [Pararhizobium mangrovi]TPW29544.1 FAD-binding protein [Pararhizobium mangrovi]